MATESLTPPGSGPPHHKEYPHMFQTFRPSPRRSPFSIRTASVLVAGLLVLPLAALPDAAFAQTACQAPAGAAPASPPPVAAPAQKPPAQKPAARRRAATTPAERVEGRIADLHAKLHITGAQQPQWDAFAQVMRDNAQQMTHQFEERSSGLTKMSAADNMQSYARIAAEHAQSVQKLSDAFQTLYASLSDDQKKAADKEFQQAGGHHTRR
jgi:periplasmic protein CpxP/Spy